MKTNINPIKRVLPILILILTISFSNTNAQFLIPDQNLARHVQTVFHYPNVPGSLFFDLSPIAGQRPDVSITINSFYAPFNQSIRDGQWNLNTNNGNFGSPNIFISEASMSGLDTFKSAAFAKLRVQVKKDFVILRNNKLQVHWNENNSITSIKQDIALGTARYMAKGSFNREDNFEDVAVSNGSSIRIFRNLNNGYLDAAPIGNFPIAATKFKLAQINDRDGDYKQFAALDRADLVSYFNNIVSVYKNNNNNGFDLLCTFDAGFILTDIELADLNNDGYNELIIAGYNANNYSVKVFTNHGGSLNVTTPAYSNTSQLNIPRDAMISISDFNADGYNDLLLSGHEGLTSIFKNRLDGQYFNALPDQKNYFEYPGSMVFQIKSMDLYGTGGIALVMSFQATYGYGVKVINAVNQNIPPPPPIVIGRVVRDLNYSRPQIIIENNRGIGDFQKYEIYKAKASTGWNYNYLGETTTNSYIDYTEYIISGGGIEDAPPPNCYYAVKTVDLTNQRSILSQSLGYRVGIPTCLACADESGDMRINSEENLETQDLAPEKFSLSNFPNPFNPTTKIYYTLPKDGNVKISVFNSAGQLVKELINEFKTLGYHTVEFDGNGFSSGVYFYRIESNEFIETRRMILTK